MPVEYVASRMFATKLMYGPFFQGLEYASQQRIKNHWSLLLQPQKNSIDRESVLWYSKLEDEINFEFSHRAIPPCGGWCYH